MKHCIQIQDTSTSRLLVTSYSTTYLATSYYFRLIFTEVEVEVTGKLYIAVQSTVYIERYKIAFLVFPGLLYIY